MSPPPDTKPKVCVMQILYVLYQGFVSQVGAVAPPPPPHSCDTKRLFCVGLPGRGLPLHPSSRHFPCSVTWQTCLLCHTADMSAVLHSKHVCCVTQQILSAL